MKLALIDADCCVFALTESHLELRARLAARPPGSIAISAVSFAEVALGSKNGKLRTLEALNALVGEMPVLGFDEAAARAYATLPFRRARFDRLLAAHALSLDAVVVTNNEADFADVAGLVVENWTRAA